MNSIDIAVLVVSILLVILLVLFLALKGRKGSCAYCRHASGKKLLKAYKKRYSGHDCCKK